MNIDTRCMAIKQSLLEIHRRVDKYIGNKIATETERAVEPTPKPTIEREYNIVPYVDEYGNGTVKED